MAQALKALNQQVVFVGGSVLSFYPDRDVFEVRPTDDIDVIVEVFDYLTRSKLETKLRELNFTNDIESGITCRYKTQGIIVDILPTNDTSGGFHNKWYSEGFESAIDYEIDQCCKIKILTPPYFIATKLEAFKGRGNNDGRTSHDFEDIVYVLENREVIWDEFTKVSKPLKTYLISEFDILLSNPNLREWIDCHVERATSPATSFIINSLKKFVFTQNN